MRAEAARIKIIFCIVVPKKNGKPYSLPSYTKKAAEESAALWLQLWFVMFYILLQKAAFVKVFYPKIGILSLTT